MVHARRVAGSIQVEPAPGNRPAARDGSSSAKGCDVAISSWIEVDGEAIVSNTKAMRALAASAAQAAGRPAAAVCAVLKADGYGLGAVRVASACLRGGAAMLAVYTPEQARSLVEAAVAAPILVLMPVHDLDRADALYRAASRGQLHLTIHDAATLDAAVAIADRFGLRLAVQLEVDTGMSRGGAEPIEAGRLLRRLASSPRLVLTGVFSHFASADRDAAFTRAQSDAFTGFLAEHRRLIPAEAVIHEANTFGTFRASAYHRTMVRVGLALLGYAEEEFGEASEFEHAGAASALTPAVCWLSRLVQVKRIEGGTPVGYGSTWRADRPTRLGVAPVGYADGYPLALSNQASMGVRLSNGTVAYVPVVGRISMDQTTVDLTDIPEEQVGTGSLVEVVSADPTAPNHLPVLARRAGTITHELLCRLNPRVPRRHAAPWRPSQSPCHLTAATG